MFLLLMCFWTSLWAMNDCYYGAPKATGLWILKKEDLTPRSLNVENQKEIFEGFFKNQVNFIKCEELKNNLDNFSLEVKEKFFDPDENIDFKNGTMNIKSLNFTMSAPEISIDKVLFRISSLHLILENTKITIQSLKNLLLFLTVTFNQGAWSIVSNAQHIYVPPDNTEIPQ